MDGRSVAHEVIDLVRQSEDLIVVGAHAIGHEGFVNANHVAVTHLEFLRQEGQQRNTQTNFAWLRRRDIKGHAGTGGEKVLAQFVREESQRTLAVVFEETYSDIGPPRQSGICHAARDILAGIISDDKDAILRCDAHAAHSILGPQLDPLLKREAFDIAPGREYMTCLTGHRCTPYKIIVFPVVWMIHAIEKTW